MLLQLSKTVKQSPKSPQIFENNGTFCADRPFSKNRSETNCQKSFVFNQLVSELQSYILSTTTETLEFNNDPAQFAGFNRTSFQQQLKLRESISPCSSSELQSYILSTTTETGELKWASKNQITLQSYILSTTTETWAWARQVLRLPSLQSYILSTTTETSRRLYVTLRVFSFNRTSFQQQLKQWDVKAFYEDLRLQSYILSTTTETISP